MGEALGYDEGICVQKKGYLMAPLFKYWVPEVPVHSCASMGVNVQNCRSSGREDEMCHFSV